MAATTDDTKGLSDRFVHIQFVAEPGADRTVDKLDNPPSKTRELWHVKSVTE